MTILYVIDMSINLESSFWSIVWEYVLKKWKNSCPLI